MASLSAPVLSYSIAKTESLLAPITLTLSADIGSGNGAIVVHSYGTDNEVIVQRIASLWERGGFLPLQKLPFDANVRAAGGRDFYLEADLPQLRPAATLRQQLDAAELRLDRSYTPPKQVRVTLTKLKISQSLSEETLAFTAVVMIDDNPGFVAGNRGNGGCNFYEPVWSKQTMPEYHDAMSLVKSVALELGHTFEPVDGLIGEIIDDIEKERRIAKAIKANKTIFLDAETNKEYSIAEPYTVSLRAYILKEHPRVIILNETIGGQKVAPDRPYSSKTFKRLKTHVLFEQVTGDGNLRMIESVYTPRVAAQIRAKHPNAYILNEHYDSKGNSLD